MNGNASGEILRDCLFESITVVGEEKGSLTERCIVEGSVMKDVERGIYGGILSGGNEFRMRNCSLIRNFREGNAGTCSSYAQSLTITRCTFSACSSSGFGGAVYCRYSRIFRVTASNFTSCSCGSLSNGGAVCCVSISTDCLLSSLLFNNCSSNNVGGGAQQLSPNAGDDSSGCSNSSFINCSDNGGIGAGGLLFQPPSICLFPEWPTPCAIEFNSVFFHHPPRLPCVLCSVAHSI